LSTEKGNLSADLEDLSNL